MKNVIGKKIKEQRERREWSQQVLAEKLHVTRQTISKWELGRSYPDLESLVIFTQTFGVSADYLLGLTEPVVKHSWLSVLFRKGDRPEMTERAENKNRKWYRTGQERSRVATSIMLDLVADLNNTTEQPLRELIAAYYTELIKQNSGSPEYVFTRFSLAVSKCLRQNGIVLSPENSKRVNDIIQLYQVRYM
ncbi:helix-turn-helix domain-containing protein [Lactiplantibacillus garii]|uniref:Helix-turn-helix domain-containing protein n=1 Tax=Lactiplantibacillus garii TaxID=2306423 RepID=A0A3R8KHH7_9LACO|nr:helix-turn-helix domain-containing protein [Lactiplantibacillus garii]RRK09904.1 helix-turn-helix domain-containing protein [Lactiplantibacillus garii]